MRTFENLQYGDETVIKASLEALADKTTGVEEYRKAFRVLGGDGEDAAEPAPEDRARAAADDGGPDADDIDRADGRGERDRQRAEMRDVAFRAGIVPHAQPDPEKDVSLDEFQVECQKDVASDQQDQQGRPPDKRIERADPFGNLFHDGKTLSE